MNDGPWRPTAAHTRAFVGGLVLAVVAVLARRPDVLVLAAPLLAVAVWGALGRPAQAPSIDEGPDHVVLREGQATTWRVHVGDPEGLVDDVALVLRAPSFVERDPVDGQTACSLRDDGDSALSVRLRSTRWGRRAVDAATVVATSAWAAFRSGDDRSRHQRQLLTLPLPSTFDAAAPPVRTPGLVGINRSPREGSGTEFAGIRPFQPGDRLRRIHWAQSLRTGSLHVTSTWADHDRHVVLIVDALNDLGESDGVDGRSSSLDTAVRAAGAIAEHHLGTGDRVGLAVLGSRGIQRVPSATGRRQLRRILDVLAAIEPATQSHDDGRAVRGLAHGSLVVMLSPLVSPVALQRAASMADRGFTVVVVDCLPDDIGTATAHDDDPLAPIAWRIRLLEREREVRQVRATGIAVVPWRGPGSLDVVLRDLHRHGGIRLRRR